MIIVENVSREFMISNRRQKAKGITPVNQVEDRTSVKQAIHDLTFHIPKGEIVGIIGSNGAGKSTLLKMIVGVLAPTKGSIHTASFHPVTEQRKLAKKISVVFGTSLSLFQDTTVEESLLLTVKMFKISKRSYLERYEELDKVLGIHEFVHKKRENLTLGEERRASLSLALLPDSELIILDEALIGMDSIWKQKALDYLKKVNQERQVTIVMTSHNLSDVRSLCSRVLVLKEGTKKYYGSVDYLERNYANQATITISISNQIPDMEDLTLVNYSVSNEKLVITYNRKIISAKTILHHILQQCNVNDLKVTNQGLEEALLYMQEEVDSDGE